MKKSIALLLVAIILVSTITTAFAAEVCPVCDHGYKIVKITYSHWYDGQMRVDRDIFGLITGILWAKCRTVTIKCSHGKTHTSVEVQPGSYWYARY